MDLTQGSPDTEKERLRRARIWAQIPSLAVPSENVPIDTLHDLRAYRGQSGIWVDVTNTRSPTHPSGAAVAVIHTGRRYADELRPDGLTYHYPNTRRKGTDEMEIEATRTASRERLPVLVLTKSSHRGCRNVRRAIVLNWSDEASVFELAFSD